MSGSTFYLVPDMDAAVEKSVKESNSTFECPPNMVMIGRKHSGDENGTTTYRSAPLVVDPNTGVSLVVTIGDTSEWKKAGKQSSLNFQAPAGYVITGRKHDGDENGETYFKISRVYVGQTYSRTVNEVTSGSIKESSGTWYHTPAIGSMKGVITGMTHSGDENGNSTYSSKLVFLAG
jgi:hypothetical protein